MAVHLHLYEDAFEESKHPRNASGKFSAGGMALTHTPTFGQPMTSAERNHLHRGVKIAESFGYRLLGKPAGFHHVALEKHDNEGKRHLLRLYTRHDHPPPSPQGPKWFNEKEGELTGYGSKLQGLKKHLLAIE